MDRKQETNADKLLEKNGQHAEDVFNMDYDENKDHFDKLEEEMHYTYWTFDVIEEQREDGTYLTLY